MRLVLFCETAYCFMQHYNKYKVCVCVYMYMMLHTFSKSYFGPYFNRRPDVACKYCTTAVSDRKAPLKSVRGLKEPRTLGNHNNHAVQSPSSTEEDTLGWTQVEPPSNASEGQSQDFQASVE